MPLITSTAASPAEDLKSAVATPSMSIPVAPVKEIVPVPSESPPAPPVAPSAVTVTLWPLPLSSRALDIAAALPVNVIPPAGMVTPLATATLKILEPEPAL